MPEGLADPGSKAFQQMSQCLQELCGLKLIVSIQAVNKRSRLGQKSEQRSRILALASGRPGTNTSIVILKPGSSSDKPSVKAVQPLRVGVLSPGKSVNVLLLRLDKEDETYQFSVATASERNFFVLAAERALSKGRKVGGAHTLSSQLSLHCSPRRSSVPVVEGAAEEPKGLLTEQEDEALSLMKKYEKDETVDARQLWSRVQLHSAKLQQENAQAILQSAKKWEGISDKFAEMAVDISLIQGRLVMFSNLGKQGESISSVERERAARDLKQKNYERLDAELATVIDELEPLSGKLQTLAHSGFAAESRPSLLSAMHYVRSFEKRRIEDTYPIAAVFDAKRQIRDTFSQLGERLFAYLRSDFENVGRQLSVDTSKKKRTKGKLRWRTHHNHHKQWLQLLPLMDTVLALGIQRATELQRCYSREMKTSYKQEITYYYKELRHLLQKKKHKPAFYIGAKDLSSWDLLEASPIGSTAYAASEAPTFVSANTVKSGGSGRSSTTSEPNHLEELGIDVYRMDSEFMGESLPGMSGGGSRNSLSACSVEEGGGFGVGDRLSIALTNTDKDGKDRILPHAALIMSILSSVEVTYGEQDFLAKLFALETSPGKDKELRHMLNDLFCSEGSKEHVVVSELRDIIKYMQSRCDMMCLVPVIVVVDQLRNAMKLRSSFISDYLNSVSDVVEAQLLVWQSKQQEIISKYKCDIKHCAVLPCFVRFKTFIRRIEHMCMPIPASASFSRIQEAISIFVTAMSNSLDDLCNTDAKYGNFFYVKNAAFFLEFLAEVSRDRSDLARKLLGGQLNSSELWRRQREEREKKYITTTLLQDKFSGLFGFVEEIEKNQATRSAEEVSLMFNKKQVAELMAQTKPKLVRENIEAIYRRLNKHFFEHTTSGNGLSTISHDTWRSARSHISTRWEKLEDFVKRYYTKHKLLTTKNDVVNMLSKVSDSNGDKF